MKQGTVLTERHKDILQAIINTHIATAEAVGSRTVAKKMGFSLSPASIRNVMADLEEMGYVRQPHTSAGRVPTDSGYRLYVDVLMEIGEVQQEERRQIEQLYRARIEQVEDLMELSSRLLSILTHYTAVVQTPKMDTETIKHVEVVPLSSGKVLVMLVTNVGNVRKNVTILPRGITDSEIEQIAAFLNEKLYSLSFAAARSLLGSYDDSDNRLEGRLAGLALRVLGVLAESEAREVYLDGRENIFDQPEFSDLERLRPVLRVFDEKSRLNELLECCMPEDEITEVCIRIGSENPLYDVRGCSIVASPYRVGGCTTGAIGVIGPTRMQYSRASSLVAFVANKLSLVLTELSGGE
ncbi:MAG: heat-inducible transcription repressor HrcA [Candidatus Hydrogenedentota bacterium]|nr:MAG: heat-inducible transcription repressor HrcA [Candidatus Hydrogenedentota bacterium]